MPKTSEARILTIDIETAPIEAYTWGLWDQNIGLEMVKADWTILAFCAKWLGKPTLVYSHTGGRGVKRVRDDRQLLSRIWKLLDEADIVVAQNGQKFDLKKINARLLQSGFQPYSPVRIVDTMLVARRYFGFTSNKLAWLSEKLTDTPKSSHKRFPGFELWSECLKDNPKAWAEMKKYNTQDVIATEQLYLKQRPWIANHPNLGIYTGEPHSCPKCSGTELQKRGLARTNAGSYQRYQCSCGAWSRGRTMIPPTRKPAITNIPQ